MNTKLERFEALDKVIINLETEAEKLGVFSGLVAEVNTVTRDLKSVVTRQKNSQKELQSLVAVVEGPASKVQVLTEQLAHEIGQVNHKQATFNESQQARQSEQFRLLLNQQEAMASTLSTEVEAIGEKVKKICHDDFEQLIKISEEPLHKIKGLTEQLEQDIALLNTQQSDFHNRQLTSQDEHFKALLIKQESVSDALQDGVKALAEEVKKIDPGFLEEMRLVYRESQTELSAIRSQLEKITAVLNLQNSRFQTLESKLEDHEKTVQQRFNKLDLSAERIRNIPETLKQIDTLLTENAVKARQYREAELESQKDISATLGKLIQFSSFSKVAFAVLTVLTITSFFLGA